MGAFKDFLGLSKSGPKQEKVIFKSYAKQTRQGIYRAAKNLTVKE